MIGRQQNHPIMLGGCVIVYDKWLALVSSFVLHTSYLGFVTFVAGVEHTGYSLVVIRVRNYSPRNYM